MKVSVIIPTLNESENIEQLIDYLNQSGPRDLEIIVVDGGSDDDTVLKCTLKAQAKVYNSPKKGRAIQMNFGFKESKGDVLYFVHADTKPTQTWFNDITEAVEKGHQIGGFRFKFNSNKILLKFNSWMTRFNILAFRGGDQTLFVSRELFNELSGYREWEIMEEYDLIKRARKLHHKFHLIQKDTLVSARKYDKNSYLKINFQNFIAMLKFKLGVDHRKIKEHYNKKISK